MCFVHFRQVAAPVGRQTTLLGRDRQGMTTEAKTDVSVL